MEVLVLSALLYIDSLFDTVCLQNFCLQGKKCESHTFLIQHVQLRTMILEETASPVALRFL